MVYLGITVIIVTIVSIFIATIKEKLKSTGQIRWLGGIGILAGFAIANINTLEKISYKGFGLTNYVQKAKTDVGEISSIKKEVFAQKESMDIVIRDINHQKELIDKQFKNTKKWLEMNKLAAQALADNRKAYDKIYFSYRNDNDPQIAEYAKQITNKIIAEANGPMHTFWSVPWKEGINPTQLSFDLARREYEIAEEFQKRCALVDFITNNKNYTKKEKLKFLLKALQKDKHLKVCETICRNINKLTNQQLAHLDFDAYYNLLQSTQ